MDKIVEDFRRSGAYDILFRQNKFRFSNERDKKRIKFNRNKCCNSSSLEEQEKKISGIFHIIENLSTIFEIAPRFATYYTLTQEKTKTGANKFSKRDATVYTQKN